MGNFFSIDSSNNSNNSNNINNDEKGEWTLTPETTLTDSTLNIPKDVVNGVNYGINTITTSTEDIFHSINNGLKNLLDLSVDGLDYVVDKIGLHSSSNDITTDNPIVSDTSINTDDLSNLSSTQKNQLLNETTSDNDEDLIPLRKMVIRNGKVYSQDYNGPNSVELKQPPLILADDSFAFPFNPHNETNPQISIDNSTSSSSISSIPQSQINKYLQSTTSFDLDTQSQISSDKSQPLNETTSDDDEDLIPNETTSDDEDLIPLRKMVIRDGKVYSNGHKLNQHPLILADDDSFAFPFEPHKMNETNPQISNSSTSSSISPISQSQINKYLQSTTSFDLDTQKQISSDKNQSFTQPQKIQTKTQSTQSITKQPLISDDVKLSNSQIQPSNPLSKNETTTSIDTTEIDKKMNDIISKNKISQSYQSTPNLENTTQQNPLNSTTSSINTSSLTTLNLNGGNFSSMNLNRF